MTALLPTILLSSFVGSVHCIAMCGPLASMHGGALRLALLHSLGRLTTYVALGAAAGAVGRAVDVAGNLGTVQRAATIVSGAVILAWGVYQLAVALGWARDPKRTTNLFASGLVRIGRKRPSSRAWLVGVLTGLLPCGWLWAFVVSAAGTGHPLTGMLVMGVFWLGTVPAMTGILVIGAFVKRRMPIVTAAVLIVLGVATLTMRWADAGAQQVEQPHCHEVKS